jgi:hypothetical protein
MNFESSLSGNVLASFLFCQLVGLCLSHDFVSTARDTSGIGDFTALVLQAPTQDDAYLAPGFSTILSASCVLVAASPEVLFGGIRDVIVRWVRQAGQSAVLTVDETQSSDVLRAVRESYGSIYLHEILLINVGTQHHQWLAGVPYIVVDLEQPSSWFFTRPPFPEYIQGHLFAPASILHSSVKP